MKQEFQEWWLTLAYRCVCALLNVCVFIVAHGSQVAYTLLAIAS